MRMKFCLAVAIINLVIPAPLGAQNLAPPIASRTRVITDKDLFDFIWVANPQLSPDGTRVAFTRVNADVKRLPMKLPSGWSPHPAANLRYA
jgi:hypothetical protein